MKKDKDHKENNIIKFPNLKNDISNDLKEIAKIISDDSSNPKQDDKSDTEKNINFYVDGKGNVAGNNNVTNQGVINLNKTVRRKVYVKTGDGTLTAREKHEVKTLLYEWVNIHNTLKKSNLSHQLAWIKLNQHLKVSSYHEIKSEDFNKALKFLRVQIGELNQMASAPKKLPNWRNKKIQSIQARCKQNNWNEWRIEHMKKKFGKTSLKELTDAELQQVYNSVWRKK